MTTTVFPQDWLRTWSWQGLPVAVMAAPPEQGSDKPAPAVVLIHGFGACKEHWRHNVPALRAERRVFALDLMGFGASSKPRSRLDNEPDTEDSLRYGIETWSHQVADFIEQEVQGPVHLVGNSIGGVVALAAARRLEQQGRPALGVVLVDCAQRALDDKRLAEQPPLRRWGRPALKALVRQRWLTANLFRLLVKPGVIRRVLLQAYPTASNVDEQLVQLLLQPALQPGADEAFRGFINLFDDRIAPELLAELNTPVTMIWGLKDPWEPIEEARRWRQFPCVQGLHELPDLGHCPHDESPETVNPLLLAALQRA
ncbi:MAG: alpha/beta fold hydrolase [Cyanobacteriota bacterium]|nr:alpha/beta fold hydrolase [Cyanobacteriota bacterium]